MEIIVDVNGSDNGIKPAILGSIKALGHTEAKITLVGNEDRIKEVTQIKVNAVAKKVPFKVALVMTTSVIVALLLAFLCIYNITVINGMTTSIDYLQEEVTQYEYALSDAQALYNNLTSEENIQNELINMGYGSITSSNIEAIDVANSVEVQDLQAETNWFDAVCNFISRIFG